MSQLLRARRLLTGQGWLDDHQLRMDRGVITAICSAAKFFAPKRIKLFTATTERKPVIAHGAN